MIIVCKSAEKQVAKIDSKFAKSKIPVLWGVILVGAVVLY